jgi:hypothetical protein
MVSQSLGEAVAGELSELFSEQLWELADWYCDSLHRVLTTQGLTDGQSLATLSNAHHLACTILPALHRVLAADSGAGPHEKGADGPNGMSSESLYHNEGKNVMYARGTGEDEEVIESLQLHGGAGAGMLRVYGRMWKAFCKSQVGSLMCGCCVCMKARCGWCLYVCVL